MCIKRIYYNTYGDGSEEVTERVDTCRPGKMCTSPETHTYDRKFRFTRLADPAALEPPQRSASLKDRMPTPYHAPGGGGGMRLPPTPDTSPSPTRRPGGIFINGTRVADMDAARHAKPRKERERDRDRTFVFAPDSPRRRTLDRRWSTAAPPTVVVHNHHHHERRSSSPPRGDSPAKTAATQLPGIYVNGTKVGGVSNGKHARRRSETRNRDRDRSSSGEHRHHHHHHRHDYDQHLHHRHHRYLTRHQEDPEPQPQHRDRGRNREPRPRSGNIPIGPVHVLQDLGRRSSRDAPPPSTTSRRESLGYSRSSNPRRPFVYVDDERDARRQRRDAERARLNLSTTTTAPAGEGEENVAVGGGEQPRKALRWQDRVDAERAAQNARIAARANQNQRDAAAAAAAATALGRDPATVKGILKKTVTTTTTDGNGKKKEGGNEGEEEEKEEREYWDRLRARSARRGSRY